MEVNKPMKKKRENKFKSMKEKIKKKYFDK